MSDVDAEVLAELRKLTTKICSDHMSEALLAPNVEMPFLPKLWQGLDRAGLLTLAAPAEDGAVSAGLRAGLIVLAEAARHAVPGPLMETMLLNRWLGSLCDWRPAAEVVVTCAGGRPGEGGVTGHRVPWARDSDYCVLVGRGDDNADAFVAIADMRKVDVTPGRNVSFAPRDEVWAPNADLVRSAVEREVLSEWELRGALGRAAEMCGAMERALEMSISHVVSRHQFGRALAKFQAVQQLIASAASELALGNSSVDLATREVEDRGFLAPSSQLAVAVAKSQTARASTVTARNCHQVHGALGMSLDHPLRHFTMAALARRAEYGSEVEWAKRLTVMSAQAGTVWELLTAV